MQALEYKQRILSALPPGSSFTPLMTLYLTDNTPPEEVYAAKAAGILAFKLYPAGATTNSGKQSSQQGAQASLSASLKAAGGSFGHKCMPGCMCQQETAGATQCSTPHLIAARQAKYLNLTVRYCPPSPPAPGCVCTGVTRLWCHQPGQGAAHAARHGGRGRAAAGAWRGDGQRGGHV